MFHRRRALSYAAPVTSTDSLDLTFLGRHRPITSTSTSYTSISINTDATSSNNTISGISSENYWYILGVASRDSNGEGAPAWATTATIAGTTAKRIGQYATSNGNSFTTICFYAYQTTSTSHTGSISLNATHEGGVAYVLYEFEYTGSDLHYFNNQTIDDGSGSGAMSLTNSKPVKKWSDFGTLTTSTWQGTRAHSIWSNGTSNATAATPTNNSSGVASWGSQDYYVMHGTEEYARWFSGEYTGSSSAYTQASASGANATVGQYNGINLLTIGDV